MTHQDDDALDAALARALNRTADDTAPLSRAVMTRLAEPTPGRRFVLGEVLVQPLPAAGVLLGLLGFGAALGYAFGPTGPDEIAAIAELLGLGL
jgi:hypothetical protein